MIEHLRESQYSNTHTGGADLDDDGDKQELIKTQS